MNTSGPSSRPRKPYPLALLNHLTVPFRRSTCAPLFLCGFPPKKGAIPGARKKCVGIVLLTGRTVKTPYYIAVSSHQPVETGLAPSPPGVAKILGHPPALVAASGPAIGCRRWFWHRGCAHLAPSASPPTRQ